MQLNIQMFHIRNIMLNQRVLAQTLTEILQNTTTVLSNILQILNSQIYLALNVSNKNLQTCMYDHLYFKTGK